jgi:alkylhydroperoxidase/carboxymuconolactone decarboxylase family protein YurZ
MNEEGMAVRRQVLGDAHVDRAVAATTPFTAPFQELITRYAWGEVWDAAVYAGVPAANAAFAVAQRVLGEEGADLTADPS